MTLEKASEIVFALREYGMKNQSACIQAVDLFSYFIDLFKMSDNPDRMEMFAIMCGYCVAGSITLE